MSDIETHIVISNAAHLLLGTEVRGNASRNKNPSDSIQKISPGKRTVGLSMRIEFVTNVSEAATHVKAVQGKIDKPASYLENITKVVGKITSQAPKILEEISEGTFLSSHKANHHNAEESATGLKADKVAKNIKGLLKSSKAKPQIDHENRKITENVSGVGNSTHVTEVPFDYRKRIRDLLDGALLLPAGLLRIGVTDCQALATAFSGVWRPALLATPVHKMV